MAHEDQTSTQESFIVSVDERNRVVQNDPHKVSWESTNPRWKSAEDHSSIAEIWDARQKLDGGVFSVSA